MLSLFRWLSLWQAARRSPSGLVQEAPPPLTRYVDVPAHIGMLLVRGVVGAISAVVFAAGGQIQGAYGAIALGFCGPALLSRLGELPRVASMVAGEPATERPAPTAEQHPDAHGHTPVTAHPATADGAHVEAIHEV